MKVTSVLFIIFRVADHLPIHWLLRPAIASLWFAASLALAVAVPDIGVVIQQLGSLAAVFIFVLPGLCLTANSLAAAEAEDQQGQSRPSMLALRSNGEK